MSTVRRIVADIGGTNARFAAVAAGSRELERIMTLHCTDYPQLVDALRFYIASLGQCTVSKLCLAIAGPVEQDWIQFTNNPWSFGKTELQQALGIPLLAINDFSAQAWSLDTLKDSELDWLDAPRPRGGKARAILGPGTGLGVAGRTPGGGVLVTEGGHCSFAPTDRHQMDVLELLWRRFDRVSVERLVSGPGLSNLYWANSILAGREAELDASDITAGAVDKDALCVETVTDFLAILAGFAGDVAMLMGALDGVYLSGGILPRLGPLFDRERFRRDFSAKGRHTEYCAAIPIALVDAENPGLRGCVIALERAG